MKLEYINSKININTNIITLAQLRNRIFNTSCFFRFNYLYINEIPYIFLCYLITKYLWNKFNAIAIIQLIFYKILNIYAIDS